MSNTAVDAGVTAVAATKLKAINADSPRVIVRLYVAGRGCCRYRFGLALEEAVRSDDAVGGSEDVLVVVTEQDREACSGAVVDYVQTASGEGFTVRTPGAPAGCTCGGA